MKVPKAAPRTRTAIPVLRRRADDGLAGAAFVDGEEGFKGESSAQLDHFAGPGPAPVLLQDGIHKDARSEHEDEGEVGGEFALGSEFRPANAEDEHREGAHPGEDGRDGTEFIELGPRVLARVSPKMGAFVVVVLRDPEIEITQQEGKGPSQQEEGGQNIEQENPAPGHGGKMVEASSR